jgi:hypothetical protein
MPVVLAAALVVGISGQLGAVTLVEDFSGGIPFNLWTVGHNDVSGAAWTVTARDETGWLKIAKPADNDSSTAYQAIVAGITSQFTLVGDFSVWMNFNLVDFPASNQNGWNEALLKVTTTATGFEVLRGRGSNSNFVEGYSTQSLGAIPDSTTEELLGITRQGQTLSAWIDRGSGPVLVGSDSSAG